MKIVYNDQTKRFSIQGQTGLQLRKLKEFIEGITDPINGEYPQLPTFFERIKSFIVKSGVEEKINSVLNTQNLRIEPYLADLIFTRKYDIDHGTHNLDDGFLIICHTELDGKFKGAAINFKDRKGKKIFVFSVPSNIPLSKRSFHEINYMKFFSKKDSTEDPMTRLENLIQDKDDEFQPIDVRPPQIRKPIFKKLVLDNSDGDYNFIFDIVKDQKPTYKGFTMDYYRIDEDFFIGVDSDNSDIIVYK